MTALRRMTVDDLPKVARLFRQTFNAPPWNDEWRDDAHARRYLAGLLANPQGRCWVALDGGELCGALFGHRRDWWSGDECFIDECFIVPQWQGNGLGRWLIEAVSAELMAEGISLLSLLTIRQLPAAGFYRHLGFQAQPDCHLFWKQLADQTG
ncbi:GNAT family N-acetyltransferase [Chitinilyticum litopenaei]|uniref:GNAT family N-acetyltransferase n=1 Tax=Chitinilyticum litopenaei TaxID=1121276 RepID=UPI0003F82C9E|nr:GNAT family N-acetyltransferase [Chitinilyticum litopenaei]